jgi:hypothetical protein
MLSTSIISSVPLWKTTCHGALAEAALVTTGLYSLIDGLVTQEEVLRPKPGPEMTLLSEIEDANTRRLPARPVYH